MHTVVLNACFKLGGLCHVCVINDILHWDIKNATHLELSRIALLHEI